MDEYYAQPDGRKLIYSSWNPAKLMRNANKFTWILLAAIVVLILLVAGIAALMQKIIKKVFRKKEIGIKNTAAQRKLRKEIFTTSSDIFPDGKVKFARWASYGITS